MRLAALVAISLTIASFDAEGQVKNSLQGLSDDALEAFRSCSLTVDDFENRTLKSSLDAYFYFSLSDCGEDVSVSLWHTGRVKHLVVHPILGTVLHRVAVRRRGAPLVSELVEAGAELEARNLKGLTPLALAIRSSNVVAVQELLSAGASVEANVIPFGTVTEYCGNLIAEAGHWPACDPIMQ